MEPTNEEKKKEGKPHKSLRERARDLKTKSGKAAADFKKFAFKGNIIDLAIAVIIGAAFGKIIASLVADIIMPGIGVLIGNVDFKDLQIILKRGDPANDVADVAIRYGMFINTILEFFIIAFSIYLVFKLVMVFRKRAEKKRIKNALPPPPPSLTKTEELLTDIKDLLSKDNK